jgi:hypothetical protein
MALMSEELAKSRAVPASDILALYDLHAPGLLVFCSLFAAARIGPKTSHRNRSFA